MKISKSNLHTKSTIFVIFRRIDCSWQFWLVQHLAQETISRKNEKAVMRSIAQIKVMDRFEFYFAKEKIFMFKPASLELRSVNDNSKIAKIIITQLTNFRKKAISFVKMVFDRSPLTKKTSLSNMLFIRILFYFLVLVWSLFIRMAVL